MSKEDWIILRLLIVSSKFPKKKHDLNDVMRSVVYLIRKYGAKQVHENIELLLKERA